MRFDQIDEDRLRRRAALAEALTAPLRPATMYSGSGAMRVQGYPSGVDHIFSEKLSVNCMKPLSDEMQHWRCVQNDWCECACHLKPENHWAGYQEKGYID